MHYNPFHNILLVMSLSGSVILLFYILIYPVSKRYFSIAFRYRILKIALAFYLIPFPLCSGRIKDRMFDLFPGLIGRFGARLDYLDTGYAVFTEGDSVYLSIRVQKMLAALVGLGILSLAVILWHAYRYHKTRKICMRYSDMQAERKEQELFYENKNKLDIKRKVKLLYSEYCKSPITMGIISPVVIISLWREEIDSRIYCDSIVLEGKGEKEQKAYGELLLKLA